MNPGTSVNRAAEEWSNMAVQSLSSRPGWLKGVALAFPIVLGYLPVGFAYGVLADKAGLSTLNTVLMSVIVFAGSAQLIGVGLMAAGAPALSIIITTFIVNLRHMLMSAAISPYLKRWKKIELGAFAFELTDETFAVHAAQFASTRPEQSTVFATNLTSQVAWVAGSWLGAAAGGLITDVEPFGLDYALVAMFIALLVVQLKDRLLVGVAVLAGLLSVAFLFIGFNQWNVIAATLVAATAGTAVELWTSR